MSPILRRLFAVPLVGALLLVGAESSTRPAPAAATGGDSLVAVVNSHRAASGVSPVALHVLLDQVASERAATLAVNQALAHDFPALEARLTQVGVCFELVGEILLVNSVLDFDAYGREWNASVPHRDTMLQPAFTHAGGGYALSADGRYYAAVVFVKLCGAGSIGFTDTAGSPFLADIEWLVAAGITNGCGEGRFCPVAPVAREQMASFLTRALGLSAAAYNYFDDDWASGHQADINSVAQAGIANGCGGGQFCPAAPVAREQMASFLARALALPPASRDYFSDDAGSFHEGAINRLAEAGVTAGCGGDSFCPGATVTREQMAAFLHRAFD